MSSKFQIQNELFGLETTSGITNYLGRNPVLKPKNIKEYYKNYITKRITLLFEFVNNYCSNGERSTNGPNRKN